MSKIPDLFPFQNIDVFRAIHKFKGRVILGHDLGLGKSCMSLHVAEHFRDDSPVIVCCPNSTKWGWEIEIHKHTRHRVWVLSGRTPPIRKPLDIPPFIVLNWDILTYWKNFLILLKPKIVIGDECQYIKDHTTLRTKAFIQLCMGVPHVIPLSATPIENGPIEFFNILNVLQPNLFPSYRRFGFRFTNAKKIPWGSGWKFEGSAREEELNKILTDNILIRRLKKDVFKELPPITRTTVPLDIDRKEYDEAEHNFLGWLFKQNPGKAMRVKNAVQLAKLGYLLGLIAKLKTSSVIEWIEDFLADTDKKLVVFGHHRSFLEELKSKFDKESVLVYGGIAGKKRQAAIDQFANDKKIRLFFGSITAAGTGINKLQTVCSDVVIAEFIWTGTKILQAEGRLDRIGQKNPVSAYYLVAKDTVESLLCATIHRKQKSVNAVVDNESVDSNEFNILGLMFDKLKKRRKV